MGFCVQLKGNGKTKGGLNRGGHVHMIPVALEDRLKENQSGCGNTHYSRNVYKITLKRMNTNESTAVW